ncbi:MAG: TldD/PmbA family protein, partial [Candidatus Tectomicrobia bacterium]|nr:TldD/PmbA family protein [Candidatus Tectomicrobia bacterium]
ATETSSKRVRLKGGHAQSSHLEESLGKALRVIKDRHLGFSFTTDQDGEEELVEAAIESSFHGEGVDFTFPEQRESMPLDIYDPRIRDLSEREMVEIGRDIFEILSDADHESDIDVTVDRALRTTKIENSSGLHVRIEKTALNVSFGVKRFKPDDILFFFRSSNSTHKTNDYQAVAHDAARKLILAKPYQHTLKGKLPIIFTPIALNSLLSGLNSALNGKQVLLGVSPLGSRYGELIVDEKFTLIDNGTMAGRSSSVPYDDEGIPVRPVKLIDKGILAHFFYDLKAAHEAGVPPTGHGRRVFSALPSPNLYHIDIEGGDLSFEEMLKEVQEGLYIDVLMSTGRASMYTGDFSFPIALGYAIHGGEIVGRVKNLAISGNLYQLLRHHLVALENRSHILSLYSPIRAPHILAEDVQVLSN